MSDQPKQINFTIVPAEEPPTAAPRTYANFCSIAHTPFDFTLTFCEVMPLSDKEIREAETEHIVRAPVRVKIVVPVQFVPNLICALQEHWRVFSESYTQRRLEQGRRAGPLEASTLDAWSLIPCPSRFGTPAVKTATETRHILDKLETQHPDADTELHHRNAFELLVATILSAQSTDQRVNMVTPALFKRYPDARALAKATTEELEPQIHLDRILPREVQVAARHGQGARRKTRRRRARRTWTRSPNFPASAERPRTSCSATRSACRGCRSIDTCFASPIASASPKATIRRRSKNSCAAQLPKERWTRTSDTLILHGRRICRPKPLCAECVVQDDCDYFHATSTARAPRPPGQAETLNRSVAAASDEPRQRSSVIVVGRPRDDSQAVSRRDAEHRDRRRG